MSSATEHPESSKHSHADTHKSEGPPAEPETRDVRLRRVEGLVRRNVYWALGVGIIPFPIIDLVGLSALELKMIKELADAYDVKFTENTAKSIISSLAVSVGSVGLAGVIAGSLAKLIPAVGTVVGVVGVSVIAGAFTQALGNLFIMHFEAGGTLFNLNPDKMRDYFRQEFEKAKTTVSHQPRDEHGKNKVVA